MRSIFFALFSLIAFTASAATVGEKAPDFTATDILGKKVQLSSFKDKIVVLEWNNPGCPFVVKHYDHSGNMQALQAEAQKKGVIWITVNSGAAGKQGHMDAKEAQAYVAKEKATPAHYVLDESGAIGTLYGAKTTPHMFVIDKAGTLAYAGAIDDKPSTDPKDIAPAKNYVREAMDALIAGKAVPTASTQAYGCSVKYKD